MFNKTFTFNLIILIYLSSFQVSAGSDPQYPASDFQPKIQFQSPEAAQYTNSSTATSNSQGTNDSKYPAANFQPKIQFQDQALIKESSAPVRKAATTSAAPKPVPKQISSAEESTPTKAITTAPISQAPEIKSESKETESTLGATLVMLLFLVILGYVYKNRLIENATPHHDGLGNGHVSEIPSQTGVEKYLAKQQPSSSAATKSDPFMARPTA